MVGAVAEAIIITLEVGEAEKVVVEAEKVVAEAVLPAVDRLLIVVDVFKTC